MEKRLTVEKHEKQLDLLFKDYWDKLEKAELISLNESSEIRLLPKTGGIYVFYEDEKVPIYVGRTKNIRQRIQLHTRESSKSESATFTFLLARIEYNISFPDHNKMTRSQLMNEMNFRKIFNSNKERVKNMYLKYINEDHDILQTMLEPYLAYKLKTYPDYNTFETH